MPSRRIIPESVSVGFSLCRLTGRAKLSNGFQIRFSLFLRTLRKKRTFFELFSEARFFEFSKIVAGAGFWPPPGRQQIDRPYAHCLLFFAICDLLFLTSKFSIFENRCHSWNLAASGRRRFGSQREERWFLVVNFWKTRFRQKLSSSTARSHLPPPGPRLSGPNYARCRCVEFFFELF